MALTAAKLTYQRAWKAANREHVRAQNREWEKKNPEKARAKKARYRADPESCLNRYEATPRARRLALFAGIKARAKRDGIDFALVFADIEWPTHCPVFGIELDYGLKGRRRLDNSPSLDRVVAQRGYVPGNVTVMSWRANWLKRDADLAELRAVLAYMKREGRHAVG